MWCIVNLEKRCAFCGEYADLVFSFIGQVVLFLTMFSAFLKDCLSALSRPYDFKSTTFPFLSLRSLNVLFSLSHALMPLFAYLIFFPLATDAGGSFSGDSSVLTTNSKDGHRVTFTHERTDSLTNKRKFNLRVETDKGLLMVVSSYSVESEH